MASLRGVSAAIVVTAFFVTTAAQSATIENLGGTVRVNRGTGFVALKGAGTVKPGDSVMADLKAKARLVYSDGCAITIKPGALVTVAEVSPCSMTAQFGQQQPVDPLLPFDPTAGLVIAGALGAAGAGLGAGLSNNNGGGFTPIQALPIPKTPPVSP